MTTFPPLLSPPGADASGTSTRRDTPFVSTTEPVEAPLYLEGIGLVTSSFVVDWQLGGPTRGQL